MRETRRARRAFVLPYIMLLCVVLLALAALMITGSQDVARGTDSIEEKNGTFDAAEAGLNDALDGLNVSLSMILGGRGTMANGYKYSYSIHPNFLGLLGSLIPDPIRGLGLVNIPGGSAIIVSIGKSPDGGRTSTVEALVTVNTATVNFQRYAIIAGRNIQGSYQNGLVDAGMTNYAHVHANGSINASVSGGIQGNATASGDTNTLPPFKTQTSTIALPTVAQFDTLVSNYEDQTKLFPGAANLYVAAGSSLAPAYTCQSSVTSGCLLFYDGPLNLASQSVTFNGPWTLVINGDFTQGTTASIAFVGQPGLLITNGNASIEGAGLTNAYVEVKGSTLFGGSGTFAGAMITLGNFTFDSNDSSGQFRFKSGVVPPAMTITGRVKVVTYAEY